MNQPPKNQDHDFTQDKKINNMVDIQQDKNTSVEEMSSVMKSLKLISISISSIISAVKNKNLLCNLWPLISIFSVCINIVLAIIVIFILSNNTIQNLYDDFELMSQAHIISNVTVDDMMPIQFELKVNQKIEVVLSKDVHINGARVSVKSPLINITNSTATVMIPAGTALPITLNMIVPVYQEIPIKLNVPVDIAIEDTELYTPLVGFKKILHPFYCLLFPDAISLDGEEICQ